MFDSTSLRKPEYTLSSLSVLTIGEFRRNSLPGFVTYSVIGASCANDYDLGLDREMAGCHCHPVSQ